LRFPHVGIVVRKKFLTENREVVTNFIRGYSAGIPMVFQDKENSKRLFTHFIRSKEPDVLEATCNMQSTHWSRSRIRMQRDLRLFWKRFHARAVRLSQPNLSNS